MSDLKELIKQQEWWNKLEQRKFGFYAIMKHLNKFEDGIIIETGATREKDNWSGDGQSTLIWSWVKNHKNFDIYSVDLGDIVCEFAKAEAPNINVVCSDSIAFLNNFNKNDLQKVRLLYLDSFDWNEKDHFESCFHHLSELMAVYSHLSDDCLIVVDDKHGQYVGKHALIQLFFEKLGIKPVFDGYQIGWLKNNKI